ncbi:hypothetical protein ATL40_0184 [Serinibacter salmoneus]|uniref:Mannosyltransferase PIG-V n=1 Tax=Serinibacter salmoneus TaxID=556530 RepID=A0A2A9CWX6_9MICO|nr:hypothetical protein ATL40_0184 [Serinibacter salmoneus]
MLAVYAASRVLATTALLIARHHQAESFPGWHGDPRPPYGVFAARWWDGWWYERIWTEGYPGELPLADGSGALPAGAVDLNAWAFFPLYPMLVRLLTDALALLGIEATWLVTAPIVSLMAGAAAMLVIHRTVVVGAPEATARHPWLPLATVATLALWPSAVVLQTGYTEALALLLVATSLLLIMRRRYGWAMLAVALLGLTRAVALPMAVVVAVHLVLRWREVPDGAARPGRAEVASGLGLLAVCGISGGLWPLVAGWVTGRGDAYLATQAAWRPESGVSPFQGWERLATFSGVGVALALGAVALVLALLWLARPWRSAASAALLRPEPWVWCAAYLLYLAAVTDVISSQLRFLLLAFPLAVPLLLATPMALTRAGEPRAWVTRVWVGTLLLGLAVAQVAWVWTVWMQVLGEETFLKAP